MLLPSDRESHWSAEMVHPKISKDIPNPRSEIRNPKSEIRNPKSHFRAAEEAKQPPRKLKCQIVFIFVIKLAQRTVSHFNGSARGLCFSGRGSRPIGPLLPPCPTMPHHAPPCGPCHGTTPLCSSASEFGFRATNCPALIAM